MNRIDKLFAEKEGEILSVYTTAGFPGLDDTPVVVKSLQDHGADMVEIGIPFSDPLADGPVIQHSSQAALENGMSLTLLFDQLSHIREKVHIPLVLMGYLNPVMQMGVENFLGQCRKTGIDGVIIPDLPPDLYSAEYRTLFKKYGIHNSLLITPHTDEERIVQIAALSDGFLYMVSDASTTGARNSIDQHQVDYFRRIESLNLTVPGLIGFGISNHDTFTTACMHARGAIIGSAFIKAIGEGRPLDERIAEFVKSIRTGSGSIATYPTRE